MSFDGADKQWKCGAGGAVNLQKVGSIVRDIGEPCLYQSPIKVVIAISKMLKPDKWQAAFDSDGKLFGFQKMLKSIILGGVDPSIRAEVWEFLLGCYDVSSTTESRKQLRTARRERYSDLIKQCQMMHSSIGTGSLAYVVGSKVMDMRLSSKDNDNGDAEGPSGRNSESSTNKVDGSRVSGSKRVNKSSMIQKASACDSGDLLSVRGSTAGGAYDSSGLRPSLDPYKCSSSTEHGTNKSCYAPESYMDFPALLVTDLFEKNDNDREGPKFDEDECSTRSELSYGEDPMHSFQINNNADLVVESNSSPSNEALLNNSKCEIAHSDVDDSLSRPSNLKLEKGMVDRLRISDAPEILGTYGQGGSPSGDRVSEWLWMLHRIVVDVVRTDSHLEFYEDSKNLARMSDILAVYAWVDPATGYCQGMSDLLSPFVVLFEDDADAFWCFEMLIRRMRANFKMEGPTGVMKQLQALWHILELTDKEMFSHLSHIGAESLHFAFRMLLVLFRRELTFNEALRMWEMIWAADFDVSLTCLLDENCPEILSIQLPGDLEAESGEESFHSNNGGQKGSSPSKRERPISDNQEIKSGSNRPFCGLTKTFWSRNDQFHVPTIISSTGNGDDELPVFCVAAILIMNRQKILRETLSIDDLIKIFNDNVLEIRVKRCIRSAIKLRKKYFYKLIKSRNLAGPSVSV